MALFGRKKQENTDVPADLQQYYSSDKPSLLTWIIRGLLFLVVLALLVWFGFWLFNKLAGSDEPARNTANTSQQAKQKADEAKKKTEEAKKQAAGQGAGTPAPAPTPAPGAAPAPAPTPSRPAPAPAPTPAPQPQSTPSPTPAPTGGQGGGGTASGSALPNSGPGAVLAAIFAGASTIGAVLHSLFMRRRALRS